MIQMDCHIKKRIDIGSVILARLSLTRKQPGKDNPMFFFERRFDFCDLQMLTLIQSWFGRLRRGKIDPTIKSSDITDDIIANDVRTTENVSFSETVGVKKRISVDKQAVTSVKSSFFGHSLPNEESRKSDDLVSESGSLNSQVIDASNNQHAKARLKPIGPMSTTGDSIHSVSAYNIPVSVKDKDLAWDGSFDASNGAITADGSLAAESGCLTTQSQIKTSSIDESSTHLQIPRRMSSLRKQQVLINKPPTNADEGQNNSTTNPIISEPRQEFNQMIAMSKSGNTLVSYYQD